MLLAFIFSLLITPLPPQQGNTPDQLRALLDRAVQNARRYTDTLRNLTADETRETTIYDGNGFVDKKRRTRAAFIVHEAGEKILAEYRRVFEVDGKPVKSEEGVTTRELEQIHRESSKYDLSDMYMRGMSLSQAWPLELNSFRQAMTFHVDGTETIAGRSTVIVRYECPLSIPWRDWKVLNLPESARLSSRGRIWIDSETAEIWRYETETVVAEPTLTEPAVLDRMEFFYSASPFGSLTPQSIIWTSNTRVTRQRNKEKTLKLSLAGRVTVEYGPFQRFGTDIKIMPVTVP